MGRFIAFVYGLAAYAVFFVTFLYAVAFVGNMPVPKTIDSGTVASLPESLIVNLALLSLFAIQHSVMARPAFKEWWTQFVPKPVERSTYVLFASLALVLLFWQWRPLPAVLWHVDQPQLAMAVTGLSHFGWLIVLSSTFLINHFELFGVHQVANNMSGRPMAAPRFRTPLYLQVRAAPDLSRFHHRVLGHANHDRGPSVVRRGDHRLHRRRHRAGRARFDRSVRRRLPPLPQPRVDAVAVAEVRAAQQRRAERRFD